MSMCAFPFPTSERLSDQVCRFTLTHTFTHTPHLHTHTHTHTHTHEHLLQTTFPSFPSFLSLLSHSKVAAKLAEWGDTHTPGSSTSYGPPLARCARDTSAAGTSTKNGAFKMCMLITDGANIGDDSRGSKCIKPPCQDTAFQDKFGTSNTTPVWNETNVGRTCDVPIPHPHPPPTALYSTHTYSSTLISSFPAHLRSYGGERWHIPQR